VLLFRFCCRCQPLAIDTLNSLISAVVSNSIVGNSQKFDIFSAVLNRDTVVLSCIRRISPCFTTVCRLFVRVQLFLHSSFLLCHKLPLYFQRVNLTCHHSPSSPYKHVSLDRHSHIGSPCARRNLFSIVLRTARYRRSKGWLILDLRCHVVRACEL